VPERWENLTVDGQEMRAFLAVPEAGGPWPAVVVIHHATGVDPFIQGTTRRLAAAGFVGLAPELYHRQQDSNVDDLTRMRRLLDHELIQDVNCTVELLQQHPAVRADRIGILGFCMGGRVVCLMAAVSAAFKMAVAYYPAYSMVAWGDGPSPFEQLANLACPLLGFSGDEDRNPTPADMEALAAELTRLGKIHEFHLYAGAGHCFMDFTTPGRYREHAAEASWPVALAMLRKYLGESSAGP
jgi:carboxymethylenebutenolidase